MNSKEPKRKIKEAAALQYSPDKDEAPKIVALGRGEVAERIVETAKENDIPIHEDAQLSKVLNSMNIGDEIPRELYGIVAEILIFVSSIDQDYGEKYGIK